jgi:hypothetical protein
MRQAVVSLLVSLLSGTASAADPVTHASPPTVIAASAAREVSRLARAAAPEPRTAQQTQRAPKHTGWIARHPKLFGALVGFGAGCVVGVSQVGGSRDTFFNALDEFACPVVGGIGAGAGALVGAVVK